MMETTQQMPVEDLETCIELSDDTFKNQIVVWSLYESF